MRSSVWLKPFHARKKMLTKRMEAIAAASRQREAVSLFHKSLQTRLAAKVHEAGKKPFAGFHETLFETLLKIRTRKIAEGKGEDFSAWVAEVAMQDNAIGKAAVKVLEIDNEINAALRGKTYADVLLERHEEIMRRLNNCQCVHSSKADSPFMSHETASCMA